MIRLNHVFYEKDALQCYDYTGYFSAPSYRRVTKQTNENTVLICNETKVKLDNLESFLDDTFVLNPGDPIHVVPDCVYAMQDIRNNYTIKRDFDAGVCNVFSPIRFNYFSFWPENVIIYEKYKEIYMFEDDYNDKFTNSQMLGEIRYYHPDAQVSELMFVGPTQFHGSAKFANYIPLLLGTKKPNISYTKLKFNSNELTLDVLQLFMSTAKAWYGDKDALKNHAVQYAVLNQHNWRDYPGTISLLLDLTRFYSSQRSITNHKSKYPKYVKEIIGCERIQPQYKDEKDFVMAQQLVKSFLGMKDGDMFVDTERLNKKLGDSCLSYSSFNQLFSTVTRIKKKEYESRESNDTAPASC